MSGKPTKKSFNLQQLEYVLKKRGYNKTKLAKELDDKGILTESNFWRCMKDGKMSLRVLEGIADILDCHVYDLRKKGDYAEALDGDELKNYIAIQRGLGIEIDDSGKELRSFDDYKEDKAFAKAYEHWENFMKCIVPFFRFQADVDGSGNYKEYSLLDCEQQDADFDYLAGNAYRELILKTAPIPREIITEDSALDFTTSMDVYLSVLLPSYLQNEYERRHAIIEQLKTISPEERLRYYMPLVKEEDNAEEK